MAHGIIASVNEHCICLLLSLIIIIIRNVANHWMRNFSVIAKKINIFRSLYGHFHGKYPWWIIEDFAVSKTTKLIGKLVSTMVPLYRCVYSCIALTLAITVALIGIIQ